MIHIMMFSWVGFMVVSSNSFWNLWVMLELFGFFLMPWLMESKDKISKVNVFFYFLMQFLASISFMIGSLTFLNSICLILLFSSLLVKMSCFPFHSWFVAILPCLSWEKVLVLTSLSKFIPLAMLGLFIPPNGFMWILIIGQVLSLGGFSISCLRKLIAYSSIAHSSWLVISMCISKVVALFYMACYVMVTLPLCLFFMKEELTSIKAALMSSKSSIHLIILVLSLSGVPPFLGFIPKLIAIQALVQSNAIVEACILGVLSMLPVYFYFKISSLSLWTSFATEFQFMYMRNFVVPVLMGISIVVLLLVLSLSLMLKY